MITYEQIPRVNGNTESDKINVIKFPFAFFTPTKSHHKFFYTDNSSDLSIESIARKRRNVMSKYTLQNVKRKY